MKRKSKTVQFQVKEPCSEKWGNMHTLPGGKFCNSCEKTVVDFTQMTDNEIIRFFEKNNQKLCGSFRPDQLNRDIKYPLPSSSLKKWTSIAAIAAGLLAWTPMTAQTGFPIENIFIIKKFQQKNNFPSQKYQLKGVVTDENGDTLIGTSIYLGNYDGTITGADGSFSLDVPIGKLSYEVTFAFIGYETQVIEFSLEDILQGKKAEVQMVEKLYGLTPIVVTHNGSRIMECITGGGSMRVIESKRKPIEEEKEEELCSISKIYPNPFVDHVNVLLRVHKEDRYLFHLYNANGQLIWAKTLDLAAGEQELRLDFLQVRMAQGIHFLRVTDGEREIQTKKIIKVNRKGEVPQILPMRH